MTGFWIFLVLVAFCGGVYVGKMRRPTQADVGAPNPQEPSRESARDHIIRQMQQDFDVPLWDLWDASIHSMPGQFERLERAVSENILVLSFDDNFQMAEVKGASATIYKTDYKGCSCGDFIKRKLPCKHMYALRIWLNEREPKE